MRRWPVGLVLWLLLLGCVEVVAFAAVWRFFVQSRHGQALDTVALTGNSIGRARIDDVVATVLNTMSVLSLAIATAVVVFIALIRRRVAVAVGAIVLIVGANLTTQVLKHVISRPELGVDMERAAAGNSLPSGHTTIAASVAVALMLVLPGRLRGVGALVGALFTAAAGVATLSAGWHRPSDAVAALLVVGGWACAVALFIVSAQRRHGNVRYGPPNRSVVVFLGVTGLVLLAAAWAAVQWVDPVLSTPPDQLGKYRLFAGYAGGAAAIAGTVAVVIATVLATVHRVVPDVVPPAVDAPDDAVVLAGTGR